MSRRDVTWLTDVLGAIEAIAGYLTQGSLDQGIIYDACRARLIEIGEAVKHLDPELTDQESDIPWRAIARMRDQLVHHYFDTDHAIVEHAQPMWTVKFHILWGTARRKAWPLCGTGGNDTFGWDVFVLFGVGQ